MRAAPGHASPAPARTGGLHTVARDGTAAEREANRFAESFSSEAPVAAWSYGDVPVHPTGPPDAGPAQAAAVDVSLPGAGRPLDPALGEELGTALGVDLSGARVHLDSAAVDTAARAGAQALTVGSDIAFAPGRYDPSSTQGRRRIAHEAAHVAQLTRAPRRAVVLRDGPGAVTPASTLTGLPEADRKRIQVVTTTTVVVAGLDEKFSTKGGTMTLGLPSNTTVTLDASVDAKLTHGIRNIAAALTTEADVSPAPMPENTTATLELDLTKYGGTKGLYRFTFHAPAAAAGRAAPGATAPGRRILVELLGAAQRVTGETAPPEPEPGKPAPKDPIADKLSAAGIKHSLSGPKLEALRAAIADVPASHLAIVSGLTIRTAPDDPQKPEAAGDYNPDTHTVTMYDKAFAASDVKFEKGRVATSYASRAIVHEIGHAVDLAELRKARAARETANKDVNAAAGTFSSKEEKARYDTAVAAAAAAKRKLLGTTSRSGSSTAAKKGEAEPVDVIGTSAKGIPFREAVRKDGKDVSRYGEKDWQESYAEAYSLYLTAPETLKALRPATFEHLDKNLPK